MLTRNTISNNLDVLQSTDAGLTVNDNALFTKLTDLTVIDVDEKLRTYIDGQSGDLTVNVQNFPASQTVTVDNLPAVQTVSVDNLPATQAVTIAKTTSTSHGNLTNNLLVAVNDESGVVDCTLYKSCKIMFQGDNLASLSSVLVKVSQDNSNFYNEVEIFCTTDGLIRWGSVDVDLKCVNFLKLEYKDVETVTSTVLLG